MFSRNCKLMAVKSRENENVTFMFVNVPYKDIYFNGVGRVFFMLTKRYSHELSRPCRFIVVL